MIKENVVFICQPKPFIYTLEEANNMVPLLDKICNRAQNKVDELMRRQRHFMKSGASQERVTECDIKVGAELASWGAKMLRLNCKVYPNGYIGLDNGHGYWSYYSGESTRVLYYHGYNELPHQRRPIDLLMVTGD